MSDVKRIDRDLEEELKQSGRDLEAEWMRQRQFARTQKLQDQLDKLNAADPVGAAIRAYYKGDVATLPALLRERRLSMGDQLTLATFLEGSMAPAKPKRGQPKSNERFAAPMAMRFYHEWKDLNKFRGLDDHGKSGWMKDEAARFIVEGLIPSFYAIDCEKMREIMERGKDRQN